MSNLCDSVSPAGSPLVQKLKEQKCIKDKTDGSNRTQELLEDDIEEGEYEEEEIEAEDEGETSETVETDPKHKKGILNPRVSLEAKFRPGLVKQLIEQIVTEMLKGKEYSKVEAPTWTNNLTNLIMQKTKELNFDRYKLVSYVVIGERKDEGVSSAHRCFWDEESDSAASYTFMNDSMFCTATVYGVYVY